MQIVNKLIGEESSYKIILDFLRQIYSNIPMTLFIEKAAKCLNPVDQVPADNFASQTRQIIE